MSDDMLTAPSPKTIGETDPFGSSVTLSSPSITPSSLDPKSSVPARLRQARRSPRDRHSSTDANASALTIVGATKRMQDLRLQSRPSSDEDTSFQHIAPSIMKHLMQKYDWTKEQAAGALGSLGVESDGFIAYHQYGSPDGQGGYGYGQWTYPSRRRGFFNYTREHGLDPRSYDASVGYLDEELSKTWKDRKGKIHENKIVVDMRDQQSVSDATTFFSDRFESPGVPNMSDRQNYAKEAFDAYQQQN